MTLTSSKAFDLTTALAMALVEANNRVIICGRDKEKLSAARELWPALTTLVCDITDAQDLAQLEVQIRGRFPGLNILINNAGIQRPMAVMDSNYDEMQIEHEINTNLTAPINLTHRLLPLLTSQKESSIVFVSSALARVPKYTAPVYCASKAGIYLFVESLRHQLNNTNTRVVEVIPDLVDTPMMADRPGSKKTQPAVLAGSFLRGVEGDSNTTFIGRTRLLFGLQRLLPNLARSIISKD